MLFRSLGGIYDFLERKKIESLRELERKVSSVEAAGNMTNTNNVTKTVGADVKSTASSANTDLTDGSKMEKLSYEEQKEQARRMRKFEKNIAESELKITSLEEKISALESRMLTPEGAADASLYTEHDKLKNDLSDAMDEWEKATEALEKEK